MLAPLFAVLVAAGTATPTVRDTHVTPSLIAEKAWIRPGQPLTLGLRLKMDPEWHTYWKNPGDSGLPTRIRWTLPPGFEAGPIAWPSPERFLTEPLASYGYQAEVLLLSEVRAPARAAVGSTVAIAARADWLECRDVCRPGKAELALRLEVRAAEPPPDARWATWFAEARARLPRPRSPWKVSGNSGPGALTLLARGPAAAPREAYFFSDRTDVVEHGAPQRLVPERGGFRLEIPMAANAKLPESLEGVLVADGVGYEVAAALRPLNPKGETR